MRCLLLHQRWYTGKLYKKSLKVVKEGNVMREPAVKNRKKFVWR